MSATWWPALPGAEPGTASAVGHWFSWEDEDHPLPITGGHGFTIVRDEWDQNPADSRPRWRIFQVKLT